MIPLHFIIQQFHIKATCSKFCLVCINWLVPIKFVVVFISVFQESQSPKQCNISLLCLPPECILTIPARKWLCSHTEDLCAAHPLSMAHVKTHFAVTLQASLKYRSCSCVQRRQDFRLSHSSWKWRMHSDTIYFNLFRYLYIIFEGKIPKKYFNNNNLLWIVLHKRRDPSLKFIFETIQSFTFFAIYYQTKYNYTYLRSATEKRIMKDFFK